MKAKSIAIVTGSGLIAGAILYPGISANLFAIEDKPSNEKRAQYRLETIKPLSNTAVIPGQPNTDETGKDAASIQLTSVRQREFNYDRPEMKLNKTFLSDTTERLTEALKDTDEKVREQALLKSLDIALVLPDEAIEELLLSDPSEEVRALALRILTEASGAGPDSVREAAEIALRDSNDAIRERAGQILAQMDADRLSNNHPEQMITNTELFAVP